MIDYLKTWLDGTTCNRPKRKSILFESATHIIMKHHSHSEYVDRSSGVACCGTYARLYRKADIKPATYRSGAVGGWGSIMHDTPHLLEWTGRISLKRVIDDCRAIGVEFEEQAK